MKILLLIIFGAMLMYAQPNWIKLNGPVGGNIMGLAAKGDTIIAGTGTSKGLIFFSFDGGQSWVQSNKKVPRRFQDFIFLTDTLILSISLNNGIYSSTNLMDWNRVFYNGEAFWSLGKDIFNNVYAGTDNGNIYKSSDTHLWNLSFNNQGARISKFELFSDSTLYAGTHEKIIKKKLNNAWEVISINYDEQEFLPFLLEDSIIYVHSGNYIFKSIDNGASWIRLDNNFFFAGNYIYNMVSNVNMIAGCNDETSWFGTGYGIAISEDKGLTWRWNNNGLPPKFSGIYKLAKSGNNTYVGSTAAGVFKSTDFGLSWFPVNNGLTAAYTSDITFNIDGALYAACWSNGIHKSLDSGKTWTVINNGLTNSYLYSIISDDNGNLISSTDQGIFRSTTNGDSWVPTNSVANNFAYRLHKDNYNRIYAITYGSGIYRTSNLGNTWQKIDNGFANSWIFGFAIDSSDNFYAGTRNGIIYKSTNDGASWALLRSSNIFNCVIDRIVVAPNGYIFATNTEEGVLRSTDEGSTWEVMNNGINSLKVSALAVDSKGKLYLATHTNWFYSSTDNGESWENIIDNLQLTEVLQIIFDSDDNLYLATDESVWRTNPDAVPVELTAFTASVKENDVYLNWSTATEVNNRGFELYKYKVERLKEKVKIEDWSLITFVAGSGTTTEPRQYSFVDKDVESGKYEYKLVQIDYDGTRSAEKIIEVEVNAAPHEFALYQNYPNPFNPTTMIKYSVPSAVNGQWSIVNLKVYDVLGNEVAVLVNETKPPGDYEVTFDASRFSSGVYFYKLTAGSFTAVKKMTVIK